MEAEAKLAEEARRAVEIEAAKSKKKAAAKKAVNGDAHPWSALSPSALKRKTAADLSEFLEERVRQPHYELLCPKFIISLFFDVRESLQRTRRENDCLKKIC